MKQISTTRSHSTTKVAQMTPPADQNRRMVLAGIGATGLGLAWLGFGSPARAMTVDQAESMIRKVVDEVLSIMNAGKPLDAMLKDFEGMFARYGDRTRIASSIMGQPWRGASAAERKAYVAALTGYKWAAFPVDWHVIDGGNGLKFFDIIIEGVKLLATERSEVGAILDKNGGSVSDLTARLQKMG